MKRNIILGILLVCSVALGAKYYQSLDIVGNLTLTGTVDGRDVSVDGSALDGITAAGISALTSGEVDQLENIDSNLISNTEWGYVATNDQSVATTVGPTFIDLILSNQGDVRWSEQTGNGTNYVGFQAPDLIATNFVWKLPGADGTANQVLKTDGSGNLGWTDSGSGFGGVNYTANPNIETATTDYNEYDDGAVSSPVDGTGSTAANLTLSVTTTAGELLRGLGSLKIAKGAADAQGEGFSTNLDVFDPSDRDVSKPMYITFDYQTTANYVSGDITVFVYDMDAAALVPVTNGSILATGGDPTKHIAYFNTISGSDNYRLIFHVTTTSALAYDLILDSVIVSPQAVVPGSIITNPITYTPDLNSTTGVLTRTAFWWRDGKYMHIQGFVQFNAAGGAGTFTVALPGGYIMDTDFINIGAAVDSNLGIFGHYDNAGSVASRGGYINRISDTTFGFRRNDTSNLFVASTDAASDDRVTFHAIIPIEGWSAGASLSTTESTFSTTRVTAAGSPSAAPGTIATPVTFNPPELSDNMSAYNPTTGIFTAPKSLDYIINVDVEISGTEALDNSIIAYFYINGVLNTTRGIRVYAAAVSTNTGHVTVHLPLSAGSTLEVRLGTNITTPAYASAIQGNFLNIHSLPDFSVFSIYGQAEYLEAVATVDSQTATTDTYVDATGLSLTLTPGVWDIGYNVQGFLDWVSTTVPVFANVGIFTSGNTLVTPSLSLLYQNNMASASDEMAAPMSATTRITVSQTTTYKLRIRCNQNAANAIFFLLGAANFTGGFTNPDLHSSFWARRVQ